jgi:phage baseplate assembly protein W
MMDGFLGTGLAFPLKVDSGGGIALVSDDDDVQEAIGVILGTSPGERPMRPEFGCGIHDLVFETVDAYTLGRLRQEINSALERWEPRIEVVNVSVDMSQVERGELLVDIHYRLKSTNDERNLVYPFYVIPSEE